MAPTQTQPPTGQRVAVVNGRVVDPSRGIDTSGGVLMEDGVIVDAGADIGADQPSSTLVHDAGGSIIAPGLVDMQVTTGEPGHEHRETLATASEAAAAGGVTTICCLPETEPAIDDIALVDFVRRRARDTALVRVHPMAALTKGLRGEEMTEFGLMKAAGAVAVTDGHKSIANSRVLRRAMAYARDLDLLVIHGPQDRDLVSDGVMNEGEVAMRLGLPGVPATAETVTLERDIRLVELTGARYHASLITCAASADVIRRAKDRGLPVTCGVSINHLTLNENDIGSYRTFFKIDPPLRGESDREAMVAALADGTIDVIVSDHDPQDPDTKRRPFVEAAFGANGLETLLPASLSLVHNGALDLKTVLNAVTAAPSRLIGLSSGTLAPGAPADLVVIDPNTPWVVDADALRSKSKNTPFEDRQFEGRAAMTMVAGRIVFPQDDA